MWEEWGIFDIETNKYLGGLQLLAAIDSIAVRQDKIILSDILIGIDKAFTKSFMRVPRIVIVDI